MPKAKQTEPDAPPKLDLMKPPNLEAGVPDRSELADRMAALAAVMAQRAMTSPKMEVEETCKLANSAAGVYKAFLATPPEQAKAATARVEAESAQLDLLAAWLDETDEETRQELEDALELADSGLMDLGDDEPHSIH